MAKRTNKILALVLVACMCVSALPLQALAAEVTVETTTETSPEGLTTDVTTTTTTDTDENGNTTVTVTIEKSTKGTTEDGVDVDRKESSTVSTITDANGNVIGESTVEDGSETKEWTEEDTGDTAGQPEVTVDLIPGQTTTGSASDSTTDTDENGTTTTTTERTVTAETGELEVTVNDPTGGIVGGSGDDLTGLYPVYDEDENGEKEDKDGVFDRNYLNGVYNNKYYDPENAPEDGQFCYVGTGEHSKYYVGTVYVTYKKDADGNVIYENGVPAIEQMTNYKGDIVMLDGEKATELTDSDFYSTFTSARPTSYTLMDKQGNIVGVYCCDLDTQAVKGAWYTIANLEDSDYYASEEAEKHIRAIALNGYWGTSDVPDEEDGSYQLGSLEYVKAKLTAAIEYGDIERMYQTYLYDTDPDSPTYGKLLRDESGEPIVGTFDMLELVSGLTEGEALIAMQSAIWSYSNGYQDVVRGEDGEILIDPSSRVNFNAKNNENEPLDNNGNARVEFLYNWLINLETEEESTVVINDKNFIEDISLTVGDKVADHEANQDDDSDNDVYNASLNFTLAFIPGENDDLLVQITYTDLDGNDVTVVRRLAGTNSEGQSYEAIEPEADGSYVLRGLKLSENEDFNFDLRLEGTQYLETGVYIYSAVGGREASQTFVGVAEGERDVDISASVTVRFDVDENDHVVAERTWHYEHDPVNEPDEEPPVDDDDPPEEYRLGPDDGLEEIPDEVVPLADAPTTGDNSGLWLVVIMMAAAVLYVVNVISKKRQHDAF